MTVTPFDEDAVRAAAEADVRARMEKVKAIADAQQRVVAAEADSAQARAAADEAIKQAQAAKRTADKNVQQYKDAVTAALRTALDSGWSAAQLRGLGFTVPTSVIAAPRHASTGTGKKKTSVRTRIGVARAAAGYGADHSETERPRDGAPAVDRSGGDGNDSGAAAPAATAEFAQTGQAAQ